MMIPSTVVLFVGALATAAVAAIDWFVWGLNLASNPRQSRHPKPLTGLELVDLGLGRLIAANEAVLPKAAFESAHADGAVFTRDRDDGYKRVA